MFTYYLFTFWRYRQIFRDWYFAYADERMQKEGEYWLEFFRIHISARPDTIDRKDGVMKKDFEKMIKIHLISRYMYLKSFPYTP